MTQEELWHIHQLELFAHSIINYFILVILGGVVIINDTISVRVTTIHSDRLSTTVASRLS